MAEEKKIATGYIGNALRSTAADHTTTFADEIFDTERQQYQNEVNTDLETTDNEIKADLEAETSRAKAAEEAIIYDVSSHNGGAVFESLLALLSSSNIDTLIPVSFRHGGMTIRFIQGSEQSSNNKYVQYRLMATSFTTDVTQWQGITNEIIVGSKDVIESGAVAGIIGNLQGALILATSGIGKIIDGINFSNNEPFKFKLSGTSSATRIILRGNGGDYSHPIIKDNIALNTWYDVTAKEDTTSLWLWTDGVVNVTIEVLSKLYNEVRNNTNDVAVLTPRVQTLEDTQNLMLQKQYLLKYVGRYQDVGTGYQNGDKLYFTTGWEKLLEVTDVSAFPSSGYKFLTVYKSAVYIYNNEIYTYNGTSLVKTTANTDANVTTNAENIQILKDKNVVIKHFIPQGGSVTNYNDLQVGDYLYYTNTHQLIQILALPYDDTSSTYRNVTKYKSATYIYEGSVYIFDGTTLVKSSADNIIVKSASTNLFNPTKAQENHWVKPNGTEGNDGQYTATDYIPVSVGDVLFGADKKLKENETRPKLVWVAAYDANKSIVEASGATNPDNSEYTVPSGIAYVRMTFTKTSVQRPEFRINVDTVKRYEDFFNGNAPLWGYDSKQRIDNILKEPYTYLLPDVVNNISYKRIGSFEHGYMCLTCDDGAHGLATYTIPMVIDKGVPCTFAIMRDSEVFHDGYEEEAAAVVDAVQNHGCSIAQHGGDVWAQMPEWRLREFYSIQKDFWDSLGVTVKAAVCPMHSNNAIVRAIAGGLFGVVRSGYYYGGNTYKKQPFSNVSKDGWGMNGATSNLYALSSVAVEDLTLQEHKDNIDYAVANNLLYVIHWHEAWMTSEHKQLLEDVIDYAKTSSIVLKNLEDVPSLI